MSKDFKFLHSVQMTLHKSKKILFHNHAIKYLICQLLPKNNYSNLSTFNENNYNPTKINYGNTDFDDYQCNYED